MTSKGRRLRISPSHEPREKDTDTRKPRRPTLGSLLRGLRLRNDWTLKEMSERTGIPLSTLAKVEHDRLTLTYDKLLQLSQRLNLRMSDLFSEADATTNAPITARRSIGRLATRFASTRRTTSTSTCARNCAASAWCRP